MWEIAMKSTSMLGGALLSLVVAASSAHAWGHAHHQRVMMVPATGGTVVANHGIAPPNGFIMTQSAGFTVVPHTGFALVPNAGFGFAPNFAGFGTNFGSFSCMGGMGGGGINPPNFSAFGGGFCSGGDGGPTPRNPAGLTIPNIGDVRTGIQLIKEILDLVGSIRGGGGIVPPGGGTPAPGGSPTPAAGGDTLRSIDASLKSIDGTLKQIQQILSKPKVGSSTGGGTPVPDDRGVAGDLQVSVVDTSTGALGLTQRPASAAAAVASDRRLEEIDAIRRQLPHLKPRQH
jgi:hypothetical protein